MFVYTIQPVVKPVVKPVVQLGLTTMKETGVERTAVRSTRLSNRLYIPFETGLTTGWMFVYTIQPVVKTVVQPV